MSRIEKFWYGRLPLAEAFWIWAVGGGLAVNVVVTSFVFAAWATTWATPVALFLRLLPVLIYVALAIAVWRSAARYEGRRLWADAARIGAIAWVAFPALGSKRTKAAEVGK